MSPTRSESLFLHVALIFAIPVVSLAKGEVLATGDIVSVKGVYCIETRSDEVGKLTLALATNLAVTRIFSKSGLDRVSLEDKGLHLTIGDEKVLLKNIVSGVPRLENSQTDGFDGFLGSDFFSRYTVLLDFEKWKYALFPNRHSETDLKDFLKTPTIDKFKLTQDRGTWIIPDAFGEGRKGLLSTMNDLHVINPNLPALTVPFPISDDPTRSSLTLRQLNLGSSHVIGRSVTRPFESDSPFDIVSVAQMNSPLVIIRLARREFWVARGKPEEELTHFIRRCMMIPVVHNDGKTCFNLPMIGGHPAGLHPIQSINGKTMSELKPVLASSTTDLLTWVSSSIRKSKDGIEMTLLTPKGELKVSVRIQM